MFVDGQGKIENLCRELGDLLGMAPAVDDCTEQENKMYSDMAILYESTFDFIEECKKRPGKDYLFDVCLCDGHYCDGVVKVRAKDEDDAYETALEYVCRRLYKALPELDIKVQVDLKDGNTEVCNDF